MKKIQLKLCAGTMCYVMGGAQLMEVMDMLSDEEKEYVEISLCPCLKLCSTGDVPPYAELNGRVIKGAGKETLLRIIKEEIRNVV